MSLKDLFASPPRPGVIYRLTSDETRAIRTILDVAQRWGESDGKTLAEQRQDSMRAAVNCRRRERRKKWVPTPGMTVFFDHNRRSYKSERR